MNLNANAELVLREILTVVQIKNNLKKSSIHQSPGSILPGHQVSRIKRTSSSLNIASVPRVVVSSVNTSQDMAVSADQTTAISMPNQSSLRLHRKSIRPSRLRPNNILIEHETEETAAVSVDENDEAINDNERRK